MRKILNRIKDWWQQKNYAQVAMILAQDVVKLEKEVKQLKEEIIIYMGAIALSGNGKFVLEKQFVDTMMQDITLVPNISVNQDGNVEISVEKVFK